MASRMKTRRAADGPASRLMDEAIELAIKEKSPYPSPAFFLDHDAPDLARCIAEAFDERISVVLVWPDGTSRVLQPSEPIPAPTPSAALSESGSGIDLPAA
jgi:hypothetical protein